MPTSFVTELLAQSEVDEEGVDGDLDGAGDSEGDGAISLAQNRLESGGFKLGGLPDPPLDEEGSEAGSLDTVGTAEADVDPEDQWIEDSVWGTQVDPGFQRDDTEGVGVLLGKLGGGGGGETSEVDWSETDGKDNDGGGTHVPGLMSSGITRALELLDGGGPWAASSAGEWKRQYSGLVGKPTAEEGGCIRGHLGLHPRRGPREAGSGGSDVVGRRRYVANACCSFVGLVDAPFGFAAGRHSRFPPSVGLRAHR